METEQINAKYRDQWGTQDHRTDYLRSARKHQVSSRIKVIGNEVGITNSRGETTSAFNSPNVILEIGNGMGNVTAIYKDLFPESAIIAVDIDVRAAISAAMLGISFKQLDVLETSDEDLLQLATKDLQRPFDHILALCTSGPIVIKLLRMFKNNELDGMSALFSVIQESDHRYLKEINELLSKIKTHSNHRFYLVEGRAYNEIAWALFPKDNS